MLLQQTTTPPIPLASLLLPRQRTKLRQHKTYCIFMVKDFTVKQTVMSLLRYQIFLAYISVFLAVWCYSLQREPWNAVPPALITYAPIWMIVTLGVVLLSRLVLGVLAYQDCPEAAREIELQIQEAKQELKKRKIID